MTNNTMKTIDTKDWILFSERRNSTSFVSKDGSFMLKASPKDKSFSLQELQDEMDISNAALSLGIKTPEPVEIVRLSDGSFGAVYKYIQNKKSLTRAISEEPDRLDEIMKIYADATKTLHSTMDEKHMLSSFENRLEEALSCSSQYSKDEQKFILEAAYKRSGKECCLQGDFQPSNIILSDNSCWFIDLGFLSYGDSLFDIGFLWYVVKSSNARVYDRIFHTDKAGAEHIWQSFARHYFETDNLDAVEKKIAPYGCISINLMLKTLPNTSFIGDNKDYIFEMIGE